MGACERIPELDAFAEHARINTSCNATHDALVRDCLDERPPCSPAAREYGVWWTHAFRNEHGVLDLPLGTCEYLD